MIITGCAKLKLLASCSHDGTIKVWNEMNVLVRLIRLNATPHSLTFCSEKADMLVGIGDHVHRIDYKTWMPKAYRYAEFVNLAFVGIMIEDDWIVLCFITVVFLFGQTIRRLYLYLF